GLTFAAPDSVPVTCVGGTPFRYDDCARLGEIATGDLDGDGFDDVVMLGPSDNGGDFESILHVVVQSSARDLKLADEFTSYVGSSSLALPAIADPARMQIGFITFDTLDPSRLVLFSAPSG